MPLHPGLFHGWGVLTRLFWLAFKPTCGLSKAFERSVTAKGIALSKINTRLVRRFAEVAGSMTAADASTMRLLEDKPTCLSRMKAVGVAITLFHAPDGFRASGLRGAARENGPFCAAANRIGGLEGPLSTPEAGGSGEGSAAPATNPSAAAP